MQKWLRKQLCKPLTKYGVLRSLRNGFKNRKVLFILLPIE